MGAAASVNVEHIPGIKEAYEAKKAEGKQVVEVALDGSRFHFKISLFEENLCSLWHWYYIFMQAGELFITILITNHPFSLPLSVALQGLMMLRFLSTWTSMSPD